MTWQSADSSHVRIDESRSCPGSHLLQAIMELPLDIDDAFSFFCDAENLERITPPTLHFEISTPRPIRMTNGTRIDYRLCLFGMPFMWKTLISDWNPPFQFVDQQLYGPFKSWIHTHRFSFHNGYTRIQDEVLYRLPLWLIGEIAHPIVARQLKRIFAYRKDAIESLARAAAFHGRSLNR